MQEPLRPRSNPTLYAGNAFGNNLHPPTVATRSQPPGGLQQPFLCLANFHLPYVEGARWKRAWNFARVAKAAGREIFWLKDDSLEDSANLHEPGVLAAEIVQDLEAALEEFRMIAGELG